MTRGVFLVVYHSPLFPAHWALWIPSAETPAVGKIIHVTGDSATGFDHEFKRGYNFADTLRSYSLVFLAKVEDKHVVDMPGQGLDKNAADDIEQKALAIPAPGKSLTAASSQAPKVRVRILNCQTWLHELVATLVAAGIFPEEAIARLANSPKN